MRETVSYEILGDILRQFSNPGACPKQSNGQKPKPYHKDVDYMINYNSGQPAPPDREKRAKEAIRLTHDLHFVTQTYLNRDQDAASNEPSKNQAEIATGAGSERGDVEVSSTCADDMTPFLEQLQGGEGGDLHEVRFSKGFTSEAKLDTLGGDGAFRFGPCDGTGLILPT